MKNSIKVYYETHRLPLNTFLLFYLYVFFVLVIANLLPVSTFTYFLFLFFGVLGIFILFVKFSSNILITEEMFRLSITIPFNLSLLQLTIKDIAVAEEIEINSHSYRRHHHRKEMKPYYKLYIFKTGKCIKLTMVSGKVFIISCNNADSIITRINSYKRY